MAIFYSKAVHQHTRYMAHFQKRPSKVVALSLAVLPVPCAFAFTNIEIRYIDLSKDNDCFFYNYYFPFVEWSGVADSAGKQDMAITVLAHD